MRTAIYPSSVNLSPWPTYSARQLNQYFKMIKLPTRYLRHPILKHKSVTEGTDAEALQILSCLIRYQITSIPFENLELHYSTHHTLSLGSEHLFNKMVERKSGRGGYCMENTYLFVIILRSLGYDVMATGARVNSALRHRSQIISSSGPKYDIWNHMVAIVRIGSRRYLIDVGFGNNSLTFPVPLKDGYSGPNGRPSTYLRLQREQILDFTQREAPAQLSWTYSVCYGQGSDVPWIPAYCFGEIEFHPEDFEKMCADIIAISRSWFTKHVICSKYLMDKRTEEIIGDITLYQTDIKERKHGVSKPLTIIKTEEDRINALRKYLGISLSETEKKGIEGMVSMIT